MRCNGLRQGWLRDTPHLESIDVGRTHLTGGSLPTRRRRRRLATKEADGVATDREQPSHPAFTARRQMRLVVPGACALPLLTYVVVWCAIGQLSVRDGWRQIDWIHPLFPRLIEVVAGIVSGVLLAPVLWVLIRAVRRGQLAPPWPMLIGLVTLYAAWSAFAGRVVTAESFGANIGGGLMIFIQVPLTIAVVSVILVHVGRAMRRHHMGN